MEEISKDVQDRLDKINREDLKTKYGISKDSILKNPTIATQLAYGQMTDLVQANTKEMNAMFSLRAFPNESGEWTVKLCSMEKPKTKNDDLYLYNHKITSERVKEALLERSTWEDAHRQPVRGMANANGGSPIAIELDGQKKEFLVSIHQPTNRVVGMPVEQVRALLMDQEGHSRGRGIYGVKFSDEQAKALSEGGAIVINGTRKDGQKFTCCVQFDAAQRTVVPCHPSWFLQAQKAGMNMGEQQQNSQAKDQKQAQAQQQKPAEQKQAPEQKPSRGMKR